jgi:hypothetical protein
LSIAEDVRSRKQTTVTTAATPATSTSLVKEADLRSATERLLEELQPEESEEETIDEQQLVSRLQELRGKVSSSGQKAIGSKRPLKTLQSCC